MTKKHWISVKRGLSEDPKHREKMGMAVWGFLHMIDRADWETGKVYDWRDKDEAEDMGVNERTLRDWRQRLAESGYIECNQRQRGLEITIFNWINPRDYSAGVLNQKSQGDTEVDILVSPSEIQGDTEVDTQGDTKVRGESVTPTLDSEIKDHKSISGLSENELKQTNAKVTAIIEQSGKQKYQHREKIPETLVAYCDAYVELTGQEPRKAVIQDWLMEFSEWQSIGLSVAHIREAYEKSKGKWMVTRPGSLTNSAVAVKGEGKAKAAGKREIFRAAEHPDRPSTQMPDYVREKLGGLSKKLSVTEGK